MKDVVKLHTLDVSRSSQVFVMEFHHQFWYGNFGGGFPRVVFTAILFSLDEILESSSVPITIEYLFYLLLYFSIDDYGQWVIFCFLSCNWVIRSWSKLYYIEHWMKLLYLVWQL